MKRILPYLLGLVLFFGIDAAGKTFSFEYQKIVEVPEKPELIINNSAGDIKITGAPVETITINAIKHVRAAEQDEAEEVAEHIEIKVTQDRGKISIKTNFLKLKSRSESFWSKLFGSGEDSFGSVDFDITVPQRCKLSVDNSSGTIAISGVSGDVTATGVSDKMTLQDIYGDLVLNMMTGDVTLTSITGRADITTGGSNIDFTSITGAVDIHSTSGIKKGLYISGPVTISQTSGAVDIAYLNGDLQLRSTSGKVTVGQEEGTISIQTHTGDVEIKTELFSDKDFYVSTTTGSIIFSLPETTSGKVRIETSSGQIITKLPVSIESVTQNKLTGSFGSGGPQITLITESGDITVTEY
ncbi:MAG: hypothetical protein CVT49_04540 [candidate division Zixibacteria bacterium HGW-Zixibacteria-1]|nr:MAG: hypothetical protein CVT49_04540 [candidate division Zixibacteria bacterium HGW-Zixibacteria-1]